MEQSKKSEARETGSPETTSAGETRLQSLAQLQQTPSVAETLDTKLPPRSASEDGSVNMGFAYAMDQMPAEGLPNFVKQNDTSLTFPEKVSDTVPRSDCRRVQDVILD